jgi:hypothetical protein
MKPSFSTIRFSYEFVSRLFNARLSQLSQYFGNSIPDLSNDILSHNLPR